MVMEWDSGDAAPAGGEAQTPTLARWESAMRRAHSAAALGQLAQAHAAGRRALDIAHQLIDAPPADREDDAVAALVVSLHHQAELLANEGGIEQAAALRAQAHEQLIALLSDPARGAALQQAAWRHSRHTHAELLQHQARHGNCPAIAQALRFAQQALQAGRAPH